MRIIYTLDEMVETARGWLAAGSVGFVPTSGNLNREHIALIKIAQEECEISIVSIFVNPLQSAAPEALSLRVLTHDLRLLGNTRVDVVFVPRTEDMYPPTFSTYITSDIPRTTHISTTNTAFTDTTYLRGFATGITKLFQIVRPDVAYFRQEAYPEIVVVQQLVRDLNIDVSLRILAANAL